MMMSGTLNAEVALDCIPRADSTHSSSGDKVRTSGLGVEEDLGRDKTSQEKMSES